MRVIINDKEIIFPSSLSEITLGQRIDFYNEYGRELDEMLKTIMDMPEDTEQEIEFAHFQMEKMYGTFAFFAGVTVDSLKESEFIEDVSRIYHACLAELLEEEDNIELESEIFFDNSLWELHPPELRNGSKMTFGEFIDAKQLTKDMMELGKGKWEHMLSICAVFLRKKGEPFSEEFLYEGSERLALMKKLPLSIALQVGFFLSGSMSLYMSTSQSSVPQESKEESTALNTSSVGVG